MKTVMNFRSIFAIFIISAILLLYGCSASKQVGEEGNNNEDQPENSLMQDNSYENVSYHGDFESIKFYVETKVRDSRDNRSNYTVKQGDYNVSTEGGTIEGYYSDDSLKYIEVHIYGEMGRVSYNIYYIDESLKYFVKTAIQYKSPIGDSSGSDIAEEKREKYLVINGRIHEFNSELKTLSDTDEADYTALFAEFEKTLKKMPASSAAKANTGNANQLSAGTSAQNLDEQESAEEINIAAADNSTDDVISYLGDIDAGTGDDAGAANIVPVAFNGLLAGSFHEGKWLNADKTVPKIDDNIRYSVYSNFEHIGNGTGSMPFTDEYGLDNISVSIENAASSYISETVEIGRTGDVLSVKPTVYSKEFYSFIIKDFLDQRIDGEYTEEIIQGISADLDNDGKQEHLISVCSYDLSDYLPLRGWFRENNNFSYLLLVNEVKGGFEISILAEALRSKADKDSAYYGGIDEGDMMIFKSVYNVLGLIDINGDMDLELVFYETVHEGTFYYVYEYNNGGYKKVLSCGMAD